MADPVPLCGAVRAGWFRVAELWTVAEGQSSATRNQPARTAPQSGTGSAIPRWLQRFAGHHVVNHSKLSSKSAPKNAGNTAHKSNDIFGPITGMKKHPANPRP